MHSKGPGRPLRPWTPWQALGGPDRAWELGSPAPQNVWHEQNQETGLATPYSKARGPDLQGGLLKPSEKALRYRMVWGLGYALKKNSVARGPRKGCPGRLDPVGSFWCQSGGLSPRLERPCIWSAALLPI